MKFKLSTMIWLVTLFAVVSACLGFVYSERQKSKKIVKEVQSAAEEAKAIALDARQKLADIRMQKQQMLSRAKMFEEIDELVPHLMWLGQSSWTSSLVDDKNPNSWHWRIFQPEQHKPLEICWAVQDIPKTGMPDRSVTKSRNVVVDQLQMGLNGNPKPPKWLGCAAIHCRIVPSDDSYRLDLDFHPHELDAPPLQTEVYKGYALFDPETELDWLRSKMAGKKNCIDGSEIDKGDSRPISLSNPHVLVRIRGKRLVNGEFQSVEGPSPGFMLWIREK